MKRLSPELKITTQVWSTIIELYGNLVINRVSEWSMTIPASNEATTLILFFYDEVDMLSR